ncbi:uncharacterized protein LOC129050046 [Pongo abelii]|uniref:uncharacterized protein LOC129050046 n=1 Tax=Pongo abelii TaxID=9601 RepID=UPI0023E897F3|nr:uncharacterized protein LOC129050046 [Pongo abelii]
MAPEETNNTTKPQKGWKQENKIFPPHAAPPPSSEPEAGALPRARGYSGAGAGPQRRRARAFRCLQPLGTAASRSLAGRGLQKSGQVSLFPLGPRPNPMAPGSPHWYCDLCVSRAHSVDTGVPGKPGEGMRGHHHTPPQDAVGRAPWLSPEPRPGPCLGGKWQPLPGRSGEREGPRPETLGAIPRREESGAGLSRAFKLLEQAPLSCETSLRIPKFKDLLVLYLEVELLGHVLTLYLTV